MIPWVGKYTYSMTAPSSLIGSLRAIGMLLARPKMAALMAGARDSMRRFSPGVARAYRGLGVKRALHGAGKPSVRKGRIARLRFEGWGVGLYLTPHRRRCDD